MKEQVIVRTYSTSRREEAIADANDKLREGYNVSIVNPIYNHDGIRTCNEYILEREIPVKPNEKKGEWKRTWEYDQVVSDYDCTACGKSFTATKELIESYHFCPNCGADMRKAVSV